MRNTKGRKKNRKTRKSRRMRKTRGGALVGPPRRIEPMNHIQLEIDPAILGMIKGFNHKEVIEAKDILINIKNYETEPTIQTLITINSDNVQYLIQDTLGFVFELNVDFGTTLVSNVNSSPVKNIMIKAIIAELQREQNIKND